MNTILLTLIAGMLLFQMVQKTNEKTNEVWVMYLFIVLTSAILFLVALGLNAAASALGLTL